MDPLFLKRMETLLKDEYTDFLKGMEQPLYRGLSVNLQKTTKEELQRQMPFIRSSSIFSSQAYVVDRPLGNHPFHMCGLYYLQEPSASSAVTVLDVKSDDVVLDLCAAPGGKSSQILSCFSTSGFLVSNEYDRSRAQILLSNLERMGQENMMVTQGNVDVLCDEFEACFDKVLVDAPCSGEGMMKKHSAASDLWSLENVLLCAKRQKEILSHAIKALKKGGTLVYSTCTYSMEENEEVVAWLLKNYPCMEQVDCKVSFGRKGFVCEGMDETKVVRIFSMDGGEGHFVAKFKKVDGTSFSLPVAKEKRIDSIAQAFIETECERKPLYLSMEKDQVFGMFHPFIKTRRVKVLRQGLFMGQVIKKRFEPAHALYLASHIKMKNRINVDIDMMDAFLHGQQLNLSCLKGYVQLCYQGHGFGFGKSDGSRITNKYPKGLRMVEKSHLLKGDCEDGTNENR